MSSFKRYICVLCREQGAHSRPYTSSRSLKRHLFSFHQYSKDFKVKCGVGGCKFVCHKLRTLNKHLREAHDSAEWTPHYATVHCKESNSRYNCNSLNVEFNGSDEYDQQVIASEAPALVGTHTTTSSSISGRRNCAKSPIHMENTDIVEDDNIHFYNQECDKSNYERRKDICLSLARLRAQNPMTTTCFENIQEWSKGLLVNMASVLIGGMRKNLDQTSLQQVEGLIEMTQGLANPFHGLSEHNFLKILKDDLGYVSPETVMLMEGPNGERHTMQYIPVFQVLRLLMKDKNFVKKLSVLDKANLINSEYLEDFCDGSYAQNHPLFQQDPSAIQIHLYYDDFEVANPLGSKAHAHKIGAIYYTILNEDVKVRSRLRNIYVLALFNANDLKHQDIGWEKILLPFNQELELLERGSHEMVHLNGRPLRGSVAQVSADNLAAHSLFGLDRKFSGEGVYVSRFCLCRGSDIQKQFHENDCVVRTSENYTQDLNSALDSGRSSHGVKEKCHIQSVFFSPGENYAPDAHHDVLEGVVPQTLKPILQVLIKRKQYFSLQTLNSRLAVFSYNEQDAKNKPSPIGESKLTDDSRNLRQYASQYWCLLRKLPLIIGDLVPEESEVWQLLLSLVGIVDIILAPRIRRDVMPYLQTEICSFLRDYKQLFPNLTVTPKMHYLLHYPRLCRNVGPFVRHWVMRYEGKHKLLKKTVDITGNFINTPLTMAKRHQMQQIVDFHDRRNFPEDTVEIRNGQETLLTEIQEGELLREAGAPDHVMITDKLLVNGDMYRKGHVLLIGWTSDEIEEFGRIQTIVCDSHIVYFVVEVLCNVGYWHHFHSWEVCQPLAPVLKAIRLSDLADHAVVCCHRLFERGQQHRMFLNSKYRVDP